MKINMNFATIYNDSSYGAGVYSTGTNQPATPINTEPPTTSSDTADQTTSTSRLNRTNDTKSTYSPQILSNIETKITDANYGVVIVVALAISILCATLIFAIKRHRHNLKQNQY